MSDKRIGIDFACNDPDNGIFAGQVNAIQLYARDPVFELETLADRPPTFRRWPDGTIRLAGKHWATHGWDEWVGNWCWDRFWLDIDRAADFLIWLQGRDLFSLTTGDERLYNAWKWKDGLASFRPLIVALLTEAAR